MSIKVDIEISKTDIKRLKKMLDSATPEMMDAIEKEWNDEAKMFVNFQRKEHLSGKPLSRKGFGKAKYRNPATPYNVLTRISSDLYNAMDFKIKRKPGIDVELKEGFFIDAVKDYAPKHRKRMQLDDEFKSWKNRFVKAASRGVGKAIKKVNN